MGLGERRLFSSPWSWWKILETSRRVLAGRDQAAGFAGGQVGDGASSRPVEERGRAAAERLPGTLTWAQGVPGLP